MSATPPPGYTPPPADLPQRGDRATFSNRVDAWVTWFSTVILTQLAAMIANAYANALDAFASATAAAADAAYVETASTAVLNSAGTSATSTTSIAVGTGSKTLTIQTGKLFQIGQFVIAANTATPANYMIGQITAHNSGTGALTINVLRTGGAGTFAAWTVSMSGTDNSATLGANAFTGVQAFVGITEAKTALAAADINLALGGVFTKTISGATTLTVSGIPAAGHNACVLLELTNGGSAVITWPANSKFPGGGTPVLTAAGKDVLGLYVHDGVTLNWLILGKDVK